MKYTITTPMLKLPTTVDTLTGTVSNDKGSIDRDTMKQIVDEHKGMNRIYKPFLVLFYTDCMNGKNVREMYGVDNVKVVD